MKDKGASTNKYTSFEFCSSLFKLKQNRRLLIICLYRKQEIGVSVFISELEELLEKYSNNELLVAGDFNIWVDDESSSAGKLVIDLMSSFGLMQLVNSRTHIDGHTLDHIYANVQITTLAVNVIPERYDVSPDHFPIVANVQCSCIETVAQYSSYRNINSVDSTLFESSLAKSLLTLSITSETDMKDDYTELYSKVQTVLDIHAPLIRKRNHHDSNSPQWMDTEFKQARAKRRRLERIWKRNKNESARKKYIDQRNYCAALSIEKKKSHYSNVIEKSSNNQKTLYKIVTTVLDKKVSKVLPTYSDPLILANEFNSFFIDKIQYIRSNIPDAPTPHQFTVFTGTRLTEFVPIELSDLEQLVSQYGVKTSYDDILPAKLLKLVIKHLRPILKP